MEQREELRRLDIARLKSACDEGIASGPGRAVDPALCLADFKAEARSSMARIALTPYAEAGFRMILAKVAPRQAPPLRLELYL
jgi:hypothetical protein